MICQQIEHDNRLCCMIATKIQFNDLQAELRDKVSLQYIFYAQHL